MATLPNARPTLRISRESNGMTISETHASAIPGMLRVLILERMLYENETAYVDALEHTWTSSIALRGFLLEGSLGSQNSRSSGPANSGGDVLPPIGEGNKLIGSPSGLGLK